MDRVLRGANGRARFTVRDEYGEPAEADSAPTVAITGPDGAILVEDGAASSSDGDGEYGYALAGVDGELRTLRLDWTATVAGAERTGVAHVEVVGGFLFTVSEARALKPLDDTGYYSDADLRRARLSVEAELEDACGVAFVPRGAREVLDGNGGHELLLPHALPTRTVAVTVDGEALSEDELDELELRPGGLLYRPTGWPVGYGNVVVQYEHGHPEPPGRVRGAALLLARHALVDSPTDDRAVSITNDDGTVQSLVQAGVRGARFAIPEANAVVAQYGFRGVV